MSTFAFVFLKGSVIRATFSFNLPRNIVALQVGALPCACYRVRDQLVSRQNLPIPARMIGQSFVNKDGDCSILSLLEENACRSLFGLFAWLRGLKASKTKSKSLHATLDFPERCVFHQLIRELVVGDVVAHREFFRMTKEQFSFLLANAWLSDSLWSA